MDIPLRFLIRSAQCLLIGAALLPSVVQAGLRLQSPSSSPGLRLGASIYQKGWIDLNKNGKKNTYEDATQPVQERVEDLLSQMTPQEKIAQLGCARELIPAKDCQDASQAGFQKLAGATVCCFKRVPSPKDRNTLQRVTIEHSRLGIPVMFGCDAGAVGSADSDCAAGVKVGLCLSKEIPKELQTVAKGCKPFCAEKPGKLDDSVRRVLRAKFLRGLFDQPYIKESSLATGAGCVARVVQPRP